MRGRFVLVTLASMAICSVSFAQTQIQVTVTTLGPVGLAPVFAAFHGGSYDIFDVDGVSTASAGLELLAELGDASLLISSAPAGVTVGDFAPGGPFSPNGGTASAVFSVANSQTSFAMAAMILPSNDWFIGTDSSVDISSLIGAAAGASISFDLARGYDAGTEEEDFAFAPGGGLVGITTPADPPGGTVTANPISLISGPNPYAAFANIEPANFDTQSIDFTLGSIANVTLTVVPEPASLGMMGLGVIGLLTRRRRR